MSLARSLVVALILVACAPRRPPPRLFPRDASSPVDASTGCADAAAPADAGSDAGSDGGESGPSGFTLSIDDPALVVAPTTQTLLHARVTRTGGFGAPVLVELWGLPDGVFAQAREARVGDGVTEVTIEAGEDAVRVESAPFAVSASALGFRQTTRATLSVR